LVGWTSRTLLELAIGIARGFIASGISRTRSMCRSPFSRLAPLTCTLRSILGTAQTNKKMNAIDIYRQAIKRTFANLYDESPDEVDVTWGNADDTITAHCSHKTFTHEILSNDNDTTLEFVSDNEDPITVTLNDDERRQLERAI
jgi:hypothetical protein